MRWKKAWIPLIGLWGLATGLTAAADFSARLIRQNTPQTRPVAGFSNWELNHASPFDPEIKKRTFDAVADAMYLDHLDPAIPIPDLVVNTTISLKDLPEYLGFKLDTNKLHYFSYLKNTILLSENAKIHNLAHEMVHYFQYHYRLKGNIHNMCSDPEPEAVRIQHDFRPDAREVPVQLIASGISNYAAGYQVKSAAAGISNEFPH